MDTLIWAGGKGTRLQEETKGVIPKPMVEIGDKPMLEHIMDIYRAQGIDDFYILGGFKQLEIAKWIQALPPEAGHVNLIDTGQDTQTGGRLREALEKIKGLSDPFMATYGDGLADINLSGLLYHHRRMVREHDAMVTLTAVRPPARFGAIRMNDGMAVEFSEKVAIDEGWINGGFYVIEHRALEFVVNDMCQWERDVLPMLAMSNRLAAYKHPGWWHMMDTPRDMSHLNTLYEAGNPPWLRLSVPFKMYSDASTGGSHDIG